MTPWRSATLLRELRSAARHDEHEVGLAEALQQAEQQATALFLDAASKQGRQPTQPKGKDEDEKPAARPRQRPSGGSAGPRFSTSSRKFARRRVANPEARI